MNLFVLFLFCLFFVVMGLSRVASGVDTLILPDRRSQGCLADSDRHPQKDPPGTPRGGPKTKAAFKKNPLQNRNQKRDPPPPPEFNQALLRGGVPETAKIIRL